MVSSAYTIPEKKKTRQPCTDILIKRHSGSIKGKMALPATRLLRDRYTRTKAGTHPMRPYRPLVYFCSITFPRFTTHGLTIYGGVHGMMLSFSLVHELDEA
jgi:hypothetical protein